ncbi:raffinose/stachyose/melibiose transport system permease protein [Lipingzhangella halophila]|uniref:Raffinose/stachyose/melibiose transport system permease protein n=1 Tax=Lipingzhangella halophila TaxID=1783352 RepID=A0A7W7RNS9_9ACTN|nr:carbohydrate ABC transporter permease [Lipingzhangella halophila]MBB4934856.1 raffinose/stachyose/melibiose transport system permease protein [Lipingzhangella halophila]
MNRYTWRTLLLEAVMVLTAAAFAFPLYILVNLSLRTPGDSAAAMVPTSDPTLANYADAWRQAGLGGAIVNSAVVTGLSVLIIVVVSALAAYPLARVSAGWSRVTFVLVMFGLLLPFQLALIPLYQTIRDLGLLGTVWSLVLFYSGLQVPFSVFLYTGFLRALPRGYEEAALIDGCGPLRAFRSVVFPQLRPITGTVVILNTIFVWNDFLTPLLYLSGSPQQTIPVAIFGFVGQYTSQWQLVFAGLVIGVAPILVAYFLMQKHIIKGFAGGIKG